MNILDSKKKELLNSFIGIKEKDVTYLAKCLYEIVSDNTAGVYFEMEKLRTLLLGYDISEITISQIIIMTQVPGFQEIIYPDADANQINIERYLKNAFYKTGLKKTTLLRLTADIVYSVGTSFNYNSEEEKNEEKELYYVIPESMYKNELKEFKQKFENLNDKSYIAKLPFEKLEPLIKIGLPKAKYYLGYCLLNGIEKEVDVAKGVELLKEAADEGDIEAAAALGDYYYNDENNRNWQLSFEYYTGYAGMAIRSEKRKEAIANLLSQKKYNGLVLKLCAVLLALILVITILSLKIKLYPAHPVLTVVFMLAEIGAWGIGIARYRTKPFKEINILAVGMFFIWAIYMVIRL